MDTTELVEGRINDGRKFLRRLAENHFEVAAACWVKTSQEERWFLYLVSKEAVEDSGLREAYHAVGNALWSLNLPWVSVGEVRLVGVTSAFAKDVLSLLDRYAGWPACRFPQPMLGDIAVEQAYIYPSEAYSTTASGEEGRTITVVADIRQDGDTLVIERKTIPLPAGTVIGEARTETVPIPPGVTRLRYEDS